MCNIGSRITDVAIHLPHDSNMLIAVEKCIFLVFGSGTRSSRCPRRTSTHLVRLETGMGEDDDQSLRVFVS